MGVPQNYYYTCECGKNLSVHEWTERECTDEDRLEHSDWVWANNKAVCPNCVFFAEQGDLHDILADLLGNVETLSKRLDKLETREKKSCQTGKTSTTKPSPSND